MKSQSSLTSSILVSIVIPVYNTEKYLVRCLDSVVNQNFSNLDIIIVDDGSTDNSVSIVENYLKDDRIRFIKQQNSGPSDTRNRGIEQANGDYICFVDADDYVSKDYVEKLLMPFTQEDYTDLVACNYIELAHYNINGTQISQITKSGPIEDFQTLLLQGTMGVLWGKMFRASIIQQHQLLLPAEIHFQEDLLFVAHYVQHCKTVFGITDYLYYYNRLNENSITSKLSKSLLLEFQKVQTKLSDLYHNTPAERLIENRNNQFYQSYLIACGKQLSYKEFRQEVNALDFKKHINSSSKRLYQPYFILLKNNLLTLAFVYVKLITFVKY